MVATIKEDRKLIYPLGKGKKGMIIGFSDDYIAKKLMSMGIIPGTSIEYIRQAPFGGTCYVKADNLTLALRKDEAAGILLR